MVASAHLLSPAGAPPAVATASAPIRLAAPRTAAPPLALAAALLPTRPSLSLSQVPPAAGRSCRSRHRSVAVAASSVPPPPPPSPSQYPAHPRHQPHTAPHARATASPPPPQAAAVAAAAAAHVSASQPKQQSAVQQQQQPSWAATAAGGGGTVASYEDEFVLPPHMRAGGSSSSSTYGSGGSSSGGVTVGVVAGMSLAEQVAGLQRLVERLAAAGGSAEEKLRVLHGVGSVAAFLAEPRHASVVAALQQLPPPQQQLLLTLPALGQHHVLQEPHGAPPSPPASLLPALTSLAERLGRVEQFYDSVWGLPGYQLKSLQLVMAGVQDKAARGQQQQQQGQQEETQQQQQGQDQPPPPPSSSASSSAPAPSLTFHVPRGVDLAGEEGAGVGVAAAAQGLAALPFTAEIYPVGGAGDRLGLVEPGSGESLPAAMLPYAGRGSLLEVLIRDLQAREYLYFQLTGRQVVTPVAIMTSDAKGNHGRVAELLGRQLGWAGRGRGAFRLFRQPLVPVMGVEDGRWLLSAPLSPMMKPGGHGAIWKLMWDEGVFDWLTKQYGRRAALVRQISNPMAGTDTTLLALAGAGFARRGGGGSAFGFMSCERAVGAAEGMNVLMERRRWVPHDVAATPAAAPAASTATASDTATAADSAEREGRKEEERGGVAAGDEAEAAVAAAAALAVAGTSAGGSAGGGRWVWEYGVTNVEYTEFERLGLSDEAVSAASSTSVFPANTNVLFVGLTGAKKIVAEAVARRDGSQLLPGLIFNLNKKVSYTDPLAAPSSPSSPSSSSSSSSSDGGSSGSSGSSGGSSDSGGVVRQVAAGRMESTMQNLADFLTDRFDRPMGPQHLAASGQLSTFLVSNLRRKVTSSAKKRRTPGSTRIAQTPDGSFYDLQRNAWQLLQRCGLRELPEPGSPEQYLEKGPGFIFLFHPALGPLWDVVAQKLSGGRLAPGGELVLEVAEARLRGLQLRGSLQVFAENVMGHLEAEGQAGATAAAAAALELAYGNSPSGNGNGFSSNHNGNGFNSNYNGNGYGGNGNCTSRNGNGSYPQRQPHEGTPHAADPPSTAATSSCPDSSNGSSSREGAGPAAGAATGGGGQQGCEGSGSSSNGSSSSGSSSSSSSGSSSSGCCRLLRYGRRCGRVVLENVRVRNAGIDWSAPDNVYWKHQVSRHETCKIVLQGQSEFEAHDVTISGDHTFVVPDGYRLSVTAAADGGIRTILTPLTPLAAGGYQPSWEWQYTMDTSGAVRLSYISHAAVRGAGAEVGAGFFPGYGTGTRMGMVATVMAAAEQRAQCVLDFSI